MTSAATLNPCETIDVIYDPAQWAQAHEAVAAMREALPEGAEAAEYKFNSAAEVREKFYCQDGQFEGNPRRFAVGWSTSRAVSQRTSSGSVC